MRAAAQTLHRRRRSHPSTSAGSDRILGLAIAAALLLEVLVTTGGADLAPNTWAEVALTLLGAAICAAGVLRSRNERLWGAGSLVLFAALAALTLASISWSVEPAASWVEANRTFSYLATFAGALALARLMPARWAALVGSMAVLATIVSGYALLVKVFPATLDPREILGRLRSPFGYWNAVGLMAALGLAPSLWAGARREAGLLARALAVPAIGVLVVALVLSFSRGALLVAATGLVTWFALVPLRLRAAALLAIGVAGATAVILWALASHPITHDLASLRSRTSAGHSFGLLLALMLLALAGAGVAAGSAMDRGAIPALARRRLGIALVSLVACVPLAGVAVMAASSRGLTGEVSHLWGTLTDPHTAGVGDSAGRLAQLSNSRARYWNEALRVGEHAPLTGAGAAGYGTARIRYSADRLLAQHAHGYVFETFADFGLLGLVLSFALLLAWGLAAGRTVGFALPRRARRDSRGRREGGLELAPERAAERAGLLTLLVVVVVFGVHSAIDWTWFIPGVSVPALLCAGWLAGRGPPARPVGRGRSRARDPLLLGAVAAILLIALVGAWMIWQPLRSADADQAAIRALSAGKYKLALNEARAASAHDPMSAEALWDLSAVYGTIGNPAAARAALVRAVALQPSNPASWLQLGEYDLQAGRPGEALAVLQAALYLGPGTPETLSAVAQARAGLSAGALPVPAAPVLPGRGTRRR